MTTTNRPTWDLYWSKVGNEALLAAKQIAETVPRVKEVLASEYLEWRRDEFDADEPPRDHLDWERFAADLDEHKDPGFSTTERVVAQVVAGLAVGGSRPVNLRALAAMDTWRGPFWKALVAWATDDDYCVVDPPRPQTGPNRWG